MPVTFLHSCCDTVLLGDRPHIASRREETCTGFHRHKCYLLCCIESMCLSFSGLPFSAMAHCCHAPASPLVRCYTSCLRTRLVFSSPHLTSLLPAASCLNLLSYFTTCCHGWRFASLTILSLYAVSGSYIFGSALPHAVWKSKKQVFHVNISGTSFQAFFLELVPADVPSPLSLCICPQSPSLGPSSSTGNHAKSTKDPSWISSTNFADSGGKLPTKCTTFYTFLSSLFCTPFSAMPPSNFWSNWPG